MGKKKKKKKNEKKKKKKEKRGKKKRKRKKKKKKKKKKKSLKGTKRPAEKRCSSMEGNRSLAARKGQGLKNTNVTNGYICRWKGGQLLRAVLFGGIHGNRRIRRKK